jgi:hypothetical protein
MQCFRKNGWKVTRFCNAISQKETKLNCPVAIGKNVALSSIFSEELHSVYIYKKSKKQ